jgi:hypothetical protein
MSGARNDAEIVPSIKAEQPLERIFEYIARLPHIGPPVPLRGLIRSAAIRQAGLVRSDEFRAAYQVAGSPSCCDGGRLADVPNPCITGSITAVATPESTGIRCS